MTTFIDDILQRSHSAKRSNERNNVENSWSRLADYILPNKSGIFHENSTKGDKRTNFIYDSTAVIANRDLSSAFTSTVTSPAVQWAKLRFQEEDLNANKDAVQWLSDSSKLMHKALGESNFYSQIGSFYRDYGCFGNALLFHELLKPESLIFSGFNFTGIHLSEIAWEENAQGIIDVLYWFKKLTPKKIMERFGEKGLSEQMKQSMIINPSEEFEFLFVVMPNDPKKIEFSADGLAKPEARPFVFHWINMKERKIVKSGGYYELSFYGVRWDKLSGEQYGRGPGHEMLPDIRTLNRAKKLALQAIALAVHPPHLAREAMLRTGVLDFGPGSIIPVKDINKDMKPYVSGANFEVTQVAVKDLQESIRSGFFLDKLFLPPRTEIGEMSATEVSRRIEEIHRVLGTVFTRLNGELLEPLILRSFSSMLRGKAFPEQPAILKTRGINLDVGFVNQLAQAQQLQEVTSINAWIADLANVAQIKPDTLDYIDEDAYAKFTGKSRGIPSEIINSQNDVIDIRAKRQQAQAQAQQLEAGTKMADIASKIGGAGV